ncbi:MAG: SMC-Scp complex subunit ScpB [Christensenellales bacterium]
MLCDKSKLIDVVEGILFVSGSGVAIKDIAEKLEVEKSDVDKAVEELKTRLAGSGINLITYRGNAQLCSNPDIAEDIATVLNPIREKLLTKAAMETLAIVAYKQPVTRLEIEQIRGGASSDYAMQILMNFKLVEVVGRKDAVGKPLLFGTTDEFLKRFNLNALEDLPDYEELLERIQVLKQEANDSLYRSTEIIPDEELPDSKEKAQAEEEKEQKAQLDKEPTQKSNKENSVNKDKEDGSALPNEDKTSNDAENVVAENDNNTTLTEEQTKEVLQNANDQDDDFMLQKDQDLL